MVPVQNKGKSRILSSRCSFYFSQLARRIQNKPVFVVTDFHNFTDRKRSVGIS